LLARREQLSYGATILLGTIAGLTIFIGLPAARVRGLPKPVKGFLNAVTTGILIFLLWDVLSKATEPVTWADLGEVPRSPCGWTPAPL
jgi:ZIP family zinc transporter